MFCPEHWWQWDLHLGVYLEVFKCTVVTEEGENGFSPTTPGEEYFLQIAIRCDASLRLTPP